MAVITSYDRRTLVATLLLACAGLAFSSCRTSQQEARRNSSAHTQLAQGQSQLATGQSALSHEVDSLLLVEQKLVEVIDSMTSLVDADHTRIHNLEREIATLRARVMGTPPRPATGSMLPPPASDPPINSYRGARSPDQPQIGDPYRQSIPPPPSQQQSAPPPTMPQQNGQSYAPQLSTIPPAIPPTDTASSAPSNAAPPNGANLQDRYAAALRLFNDNSFDASLTAFQSLEQDDPNGPYASNYKYWQGECYYAQKRYNQALSAFGIVLAQYPHTTKAPASQFKIGECYERMNLVSSARDAYQRLIDEYPTSEFRARAQTRLKALKP